MYFEHGFEPPDTPVMALHRGRIDLLDAHLARDPDPSHAHVRDRRRVSRSPLRAPATVQRTGDAGARHDAASTSPPYFDELEIAEWLARPGHGCRTRDRRSTRTAFGGYTALFSTSVSQRNFWVNYGKGQPDEARFTRLLLDRGADPNVRASLRARLEQGHGGGPLREYRDVTPLGWGEQYHAKIFVSRESLRLIEARGGGR
jgi:hypothetical protein